jgi:hypothetical protein
MFRKRIFEPITELENAGYVQKSSILIGALPRNPILIGAGTS